MSLFRKEVFDAQRRKLHGDVILVQPLGLKLIAGMLAVVGALLLTFAATREYTRKETALGYIAPESGVTAVRATRGGVLTNLMVSEGSPVEVGTPLFESRLDIETGDGFVSERRKDSLQDRLFQLDLRVADLDTRFDAEERRLRALISSLEAELQALARSRDIQREATRVATERFERYAKLLEEEVISGIEFEAAQSQSLNAKLSLESLQQQYLAKQATLRDARFQLGALATQKREEASRLASERSQVDESLASVDAQSNYMVRSPIRGRVSAVSAQPGELLEPGRTVVILVPDDTPLEAVILVPSAASGFIAPGQDVNLLMDAFPYQKFGSLPATVVDISDAPFLPGDLVSPIPVDRPMYRVRASLDRASVSAYGEDVPLKPGMTLVGDIVLDRRSILEWMFEPLFAAANR